MDKKIKERINQIKRDKAVSSFEDTVFMVSSETSIGSDIIDLPIPLVFSISKNITKKIKAEQKSYK